MEGKPQVADAIRLETEDLGTLIRDWCNEFCQHVYGRGPDDSEDGGLVGFTLTFSDLDDLAKYLAPRMKK